MSYGRHLFTATVITPKFQQGTFLKNLSNFNNHDLVFAFECQQQVCFCYSCVNWITLSSRISFSNAGIYLLEVKNRNARSRCEICSELTIKTPEWRHLHRAGFFIVNFKHIWKLVLVFLLLTLNMQMPTGSYLLFERILLFPALLKLLLNHLFPSSLSLPSENIRWVKILLFSQRNVSNYQDKDLQYGYTEKYIFLW